MLSTLDFMPPKHQIEPMRALEPLLAHLPLIFIAGEHQTAPERVFRGRGSVLPLDLMLMGITLRIWTAARPPRFA
jgi:hypothetical protein